MRMLDLIAKKRDGHAHSPEELAFIVHAAAAGSVPDYQLSAWLMAVLQRSMTRPETTAFTDSMARSGLRLMLPGTAVDKHSTGGVGDGVSLALAPLVAAAGVTVPMMSGRGLGHTGGTLDKLESVRGLKVRMKVPQVERQLRKLGVCMFGQSGELAPADGKLYALRDATATVPARPLIVASILSKKLAEDLDGLVLDVKCGTGAIFQTEAEARSLAADLISTAKALGLGCVGLLTGMDEPLGRAIGNSLELRQAVAVLQGDESCGDYLEVLYTLGGWMLVLARKARTAPQGAEVLRGLVRSGKALDRFRAMVKAQGGDPRVADDPDKVLPRAKKSLPLLAARAGWVTRLDALAAGRAGVALGAGRSHMEDTLDYSAGIVLAKKVGDPVSRGTEVARLYGADAASLRAGHALLAAGLEIGPRPPRRVPVVRKVWR
ncbi:MAG: thymidine phosphorylase [Elusimicrobia bacterium]|nr:thymidine phosphorylase [Elusimicrobiota bacterium]